MNKEPKITTQSENKVINMRPEREQLIDASKRAHSKIQIPKNYTENPVNKLDEVINKLIDETVDSAIIRGLITEADRDEQIAILTEYAVMSNIKKEDFDNNGYKIMTEMDEIIEANRKLDKAA